MFRCIQHPHPYIQEQKIIGTVIIQAFTNISRWAALPTYRQGMWTTWPTHWWTALTPPRRSWLLLVIREETADVVSVRDWRMLKTPGSQGWGHSMLPMALIPEMRSRVDQESTTDMLPQVKFAQNLHKICTKFAHQIYTHRHKFAFQFTFARLLFFASCHSLV